MAEPEQKSQDALNESRILMLGVQVLLSFQYSCALEPAFDKLPYSSQILELFALAFLMIAFGLFVAPAPNHLLVWSDDDGPNAARWRIGGSAMTCESRSLHARPASAAADDDEPVRPALAEPDEFPGPRGRDTDQDQARGFPHGPEQPTLHIEAEYTTATGSAVTPAKQPRARGWVHIRNSTLMTGPAESKANRFSGRCWRIWQRDFPNARAGFPSKRFLVTLTCTS